MFLLSGWGKFMLGMRQHIGSSTDNNLLDRLCNYYPSQSTQNTATYIKDRQRYSPQL